MISNQLAKKILLACTETGADFAELFFEDKTKNAIQAEGGKISTVNNSHISGLGIRIILDKERVYGYTNDTSEDAMMNLATKLASSFHKNRVINDFKFQLISGSSHKILKHPSSVSTEEKASIIKQAHNYVKGYDEVISQTKVALLDESQTVHIFNTNGKHVTDERVHTRIYITAIASHEGTMQVGTEGPGGSVGYELLDQINLKEVCESAAETAKTMVFADEAPSKVMPVVIDNGFGGVIFHEACGHPLEATAVAKGLSVFAGKMGEQIASTLVTAIDDGTIENGWGSANFDDEGNPTKHNVLIKDGILTSYLVDDFNTRLMDHDSNGSARRESYKYMPTSRMSNTYIDNGHSTVDEIIKDTTYGLYAKKLGGGSVNPTTGDFNFAVLEGYIIENGEVKEPVRGATLVGNGADILMKIDMVGNNLERAQGMCGSVSGSICADVGQPTLRVSSMTVGGRKHG